MSHISVFDPRMMVWVDETGFRQKNSIRNYGYSSRGMKAQDQHLKLGRSSINVIGIMSLWVMEDIYITQESVNGDLFEHFVATCLLPLLMPFNGINTHSIVIMDMQLFCPSCGKNYKHDNQCRCSFKVSSSL